MTKKQFCIRFFLILITLSFVFLNHCGESFAELKSKDLPNRKGVKIGEIILHGAFKTQEELESNIFLTSKHSKDKFDAITMLGPSCGIEIPLRDNSISLDYDMGIYLYGKYPDQNHIDHRVRGLAEINWTDYNITAEDVYRIYTDRAADEDSNRVKRYVNTFRTGIAAQFDQLGFDLGYNNNIDAYGSAKDLIYESMTYEDKDNVTNMIDAAVSYRFMPKTSIFFEMDLGRIHYYNSSLSPDSYFIETVVGLKGRPTNKITANIKGGFKYQHYDKAEIINDKAYIGPVIKGGLSFTVTPRDILTLELERGIYESLYKNMNYYTLNLAALKYTHKFNNKISLVPFGAYQLNQYPGASMEGDEIGRRYDNFFYGGCALRYDVKEWLSAEAKYEYKQKVSKFSTYDYVDNIVTINGTAGF